MGPLRRGLILTLVPGTAWAEVCDKARPGWDGTQASAVSEAVNLMTSPAGLILLLISALALRFRYQWVGLAAVLMWTAFITMVTMADPTGIRADAMVEGCIGPPTLFIALAAAICVAIVLWTKPRTPDDPPPEG
ncbi:hypothetical protein [uncultured Tateyamaria sp.]|uniref:hypothetical protein n=1 Tax=Tateyamaria sp. 1078 TaxID=3417464 RepID=UPI002628CA02|nr:hypothetical protein [uncultured Tateyamaria sp.]